MKRKMGKPHSGNVQARGDFGEDFSKLKLPQPPVKNLCEKSLPVGRVPVFTLIRTDTTLDLSQKAEKV